MSNNNLLPYSIRCLQAIEALTGGRKKLAMQLNLTERTITMWVFNKHIPQRALLKLLDLGMDKFTAEELLGRFDSVENGDEN